MAQPAAKTGAGPTVLVAIDQLFPREKRIFIDDVAARIIPTGMKFFINMMKPLFIRNWMIRSAEQSVPGLWAGQLCRKRYIDEKLEESISKIDSVVNLGSGFDTRAYRLKSLSKTPYWEVDQASNINLKQKQVRKAFGNTPPNVRYVPIDFDRENLSSVLNENGYPANQVTFFIWEAVSQYLTTEGIESTFKFLSNAQRGSRLVFSYVRKDFLEGREMYNWKKAYDQYVKKKVWLSGFDPLTLPDFLKGYGWNLIEDVSYDQLAKKYVEPTGRNLASTQVERLAFAEKL